MNIFTSISINFLQPFLYVIESLLVGDVIYNNNSMSSTVIRWSNGSIINVRNGWRPRKGGGGWMGKFSFAIFKEKRTYLNRSCPAVSQIWSFTMVPSMLIVLIFYKNELVLSCFVAMVEVGWCGGKNCFPHQKKTYQTYKVDSNCTYKWLCKGVICKSQQERWFSYARVSNQ